MGKALLLMLLLFGSVIKGYADVPIKPTVILRPNCPLIYKGERVTLQCDIKGGGGAQWTYEWRARRLPESPTSKEYFHINSANESDSGEYSCRGRNRYDITDWSDKILLTVYKLSVSPSWLNAGDSLTLSCELERPAPGTKFFWYKAVPVLSRIIYSYDLLPGSSNGTEENFYILSGQTNTTGYVCSAGCGEPRYGDPSFVWSADPRPSASLSVSPDRPQHFTSDFVSLSCEGNSADWRVRRFTETGWLSDCSTYGKMNGSTCKTSWSVGGVFWCESGSGDLSNAVNITIQGYFDSLILESPVHPVTEGDPVTLSCRDEEQKLLSDVFFYHNKKLIHNDSRKELKISAVSKSDEGFYMCKYSGKESKQSWMSVRGRAAMSSPVSSSVLLISGSVGGAMLIILLLLIWCYGWSRDLWCVRLKQSESNVNHGVSHPESHEYSSPLHGNSNLYESIKPSDSTENEEDESRDVTYSLIELKDKKRKPRKPEEGAVYSEVKTGPPEQRSRAEAVYSEIEPGAPLDNNAAM